jgi:hypothetical protein
MALQIATVVDSISKLSVSGAKIKDKDQIPAAGDVRQPMIIPLSNFMSEFTMERNSQGGGSEAKMTVTYVLNYRILYKPLGAGRAPQLENISGLVDLIGRWWDTILAISVFEEAVDIIPYTITAMGAVKDPSEESWWGADVSVKVTEFVN